MDLTVARVTWSGPFRWLEEGRIESPDGESPVRCRGVYQVYADHVVHGPGTLLYVGAAGLKGREPTIEKRLASHWARWARHEPRAGLAVRVGHLSYVDIEAGTERDAPDDVELLRRVESLTIWWHSPPYNSQAKMYSAAIAGGALLVQSMGERGRLAIEYSSVWPPVVRQSDDSR